MWLMCAVAASGNSRQVFWFLVLDWSLVVGKYNTFSNNFFLFKFLKIQLMALNSWYPTIKQVVSF